MTHVCSEMDTLSHKVYPCFHALVIQVFKLSIYIQEKIVPMNQIVVGDSVALKNMHTSNE
jgi:hypothetical protein